MPLSSNRRAGRSCPCALILGVLSVAGDAQADTVHVANGDVISGRLISFRDGVCVLSTKYGAAIKVGTSEITALSTDEAYDVTFRSGEKAKGQLVQRDRQTMLISATFGTVAIDVASIDALTRSFAASANPDTARADDEDSFGQEMRKQAPLDFLNGSTVLLAPGKYETDFGFAFKQTRDAYALPAAGYFQRSSYSARQMELDTSLRAGLLEGVEGWLSVPFTFSSVTQVSTNEYARDKSAWKLSDISFGLQYRLLRETNQLPAVSATLGVTAPTGVKRYRDLADTWQDPLNNGSGYWSVSPGLAFVRTTDPAILFGGANFQYAFERTLDGYDVRPGWGAALYLGVGFSLNENLSAGARVAYSHIANMTVDGEQIRGSDLDPMDISLSGSYRFWESWVATPQVTFSLNEDAGPAALSLRIKRQFY